MPLSDVFVIVNPAADRGRAGLVAPRIEAALRAAGVRFRLVLTTGPGHASVLAEEAAREGWSAVIVAGGDGAVHEVVNGLMRAAGDGPSLPLGVVGWGSGNDFIKMLGLPHHRPEEALRRILAAEPRGVDVGKVVRCVAEKAPPGDWYFVNGIGLGFDAQVAVAARGIRRLRGFAIYAVAAARTLSRLRTPRMRVAVDGREVADRPLLLATIGNGACHGGSFWLCPRASVDDGLLDVLVADGRGLAGVLTLLPRVLRGGHLTARGVELHRGARVEVASDEPLPLHADGEIVAAGVREISIRILPGRLRVLAPDPAALTRRA